MKSSSVNFFNLIGETFFGCFIAFFMLQTRVKRTCENLLESWVADRYP